MQVTADDAMTHERLTPRERDVVRGVAAGKTNREIATGFGLSEQSVKNILSTVYLKCGVRNRLELALCVFRHRLAPDYEVMNDEGAH
jgi:DNA-binding NarL/FixJ family response regulator